MNPSPSDDIKKICERIVAEPKLYGDAVEVARFCLDRLGEQGKLTEEIKALKAEAARRQEQEFDDAEFT